jgi:hypothetical protein
MDADPSTNPLAELDIPMLISSFISQIYNPAPPTGSILYHYTDFAGLQGILESHTLRATYNKVMKDASEQEYAANLLTEVLCASLRKKKLDCPVDMQPLLKQKHFLACFCETDDLLSMWRGYAGDGGGYCLGFDYTALRNVGVPDTSVGRSVPLLVPVSYGVVPQTVQKLLEAFFAHPAVGSSAMEQLIIAMAPFFPSMIKHDAFKEETEWRSIVRDPAPERVKFRAGAANIKPYVELSLRGQPLPLVTLTYGPTLRREDKPEEILGWMLEQQGYKGVKVKNSGIPYRS